MRLNGDYWKNDVDDDENGEEKGIDEHKLVVGYALTTKKVKSFLQPKLEGFARKKGILFVEIDQCRPLSDQGPFDIVLHKLTGKEWQRILEDYREKHPEVTVLDPPHAIQHLLNRQSMLQDVADLNLSDGCGIVGVPKQLVISKDASSIPDAVTKAGLALPLVVQPLSAKSHELSLAYDPFSLSKLEPPVVLQEFVNHGGVLFKVYIIGETIRVVRRFSLPDVDEHESLNSAGVFRFPRVSSASASADDADLDPGIADEPKGSDIVLEAILEAEVAHKAKQFFSQPENQIPQEMPKDRSELSKTSATTGASSATKSKTLATTGASSATQPAASALTVPPAPTEAPSRTSVPVDIGGGADRGTADSLAEVLTTPLAHNSSGDE